AFDLFRRGDNVEDIIHVRRFPEIDAHVPDSESKSGCLFFSLLEEGAVVGPDQPQIIRAAALHETQIACVIDDAGEIRVFVVDADGLMMPAVANFSVERIAHRHGTSFCIACSQCCPSKDRTESEDRSMPSRHRTFTSILSGSERGTQTGGTAACRHE